MKKLKIIFSQYDDLKNPFYAGGGSLAVHEIARRFARNADVTVLTGNYKDAKDGFIDGVYYKRIGLPFAGPKFGQIIHHLLHPFNVKKLNHDIWLESFTPPFSVSLTPLYAKKPVIGLVHMLSGKEMRRKYKIPFNWIENLGLKKYKYFIVMNKTDRMSILKTNPNAIVKVIGNGINLPQIAGNKTPRHILFLGRIEISQKGLDLLIKAYALNQKKIILPLVFAGTGSDKEIKSLKKLINDNGLNNKVFLAGKVEGKKKSELLNRSMFVVVPSRQESFSITALEAISYGKPVISFDIDGLAWLPPDCRLISKKEDVKDFANLMYKLYSNKSLREKMSFKSVIFSKSFSWEKKFKAYSDFVNEVLLN
jgi:glycosyltransferase involved in cell wall biosynthesis